MFLKSTAFPKPLKIPSNVKAIELNGWARITIQNIYSKISITFPFELNTEKEKSNELEILLKNEKRNRREEKQRVDKQIESIAHSTCAILLPKKKHYDCFYVNPHGRDLKETNFFKFLKIKKIIN